MKHWKVWWGIKSCQEIKETLISNTMTIVSVSSETSCWSFSHHCLLSKWCQSECLEMISYIVFAGFIITVNHVCYCVINHMKFTFIKSHGSLRIPALTFAFPMSCWWGIGSRISSLQQSSSDPWCMSVWKANIKLNICSSAEERGGKEVLLFTANALCWPDKVGGWLPLFQWMRDNYQKKMRS